MDEVGQIENVTQNRVVKLFREQLGYTYLVDWEDRINNSNIKNYHLEVFSGSTNRLIRQTPPINN